MKGKNKLYQQLEKIFIGSKIEIWKYSDNELLNKEPVKKLISIFPKWFKILERGIKRDKSEALRTLRHTIHTLKVYFSLLDDEFEKNIDEKNIKSLKGQLEKLYQYNSLYFPLILLYHDIGRPFNRTWHTFKSEKLIKRNKLLELFNLPEQTEKLILIVIKHHLLVGTIFTGESSYYGSIALLSDLKGINNNVSDHQIRILFKTMKAFTLIDIWGYDYSEIYNHYFSYYNEISTNLIKIFQKSIKLNEEDGQKKCLKRVFFQLDNKNLKWRIACSMRIFQFITVKPYLTEEFYFSKIENGLANIGTSWKEFQEKLRDVHPRFQFKYALPLMMVLSSKKFRREAIDDSFTIQSKIFSFWSTCADIIENKISKESNSNFDLFYLVFDFPRHWFFNSPDRERIRANIINALHSSTFSFDAKKSAYILTIDMNCITNRN